MINEKEIQERVNRRLSGLDSSMQRRERIRAAVLQKEEQTPVKRTISRTLAFALVAVLLMATVAIAEHFNLFNFFAKNDARYAAVAPYATLTMSEPALVEHPYLGEVTASIDSAYFDGLALNLAYRIDHPSHVEEYTPMADEIAEMQLDEPLIIALVGNEPWRAIYEAYNTAVSNGTPFGYRQYTIYPSDHTVTEDGIDIPPYSAMEDYDESGSYCEMREFETPLPLELSNRDKLNVSIMLYQQETSVWFDGKDCYLRYDREEIGQMEATIPLTEKAVHDLSGTGLINGVECKAEAKVSKMAASITVTCSAPLNTFLRQPPEGTEYNNSWLEVKAVDEQGNTFRQQEGFAVDDRTAFTIPFQGTGSLPESLTLYLYTIWEGMDNPDLTQMDGIPLQIIHQK